MKVLSAIGRFFARIGRWIKETAWIQPLLIVGAIFAVIFAIPHIIDGVKGLFNESDAANKYFAKYQLSLKNADNIPDGQSVGTSKVDELFTYIEEGNQEKVTSIAGGDRFFIAFVEESSSSCKDLYGGLKMFQDKYNKNDEFNGLEGSFKLITIYTDATSSDDDSVNLFDQVWLNHYSFFETLSTPGFLDKTYYAQNKNYAKSNYESAFISESLSECPMSAPLVMYFDYTYDLPKNNKDVNPKVKGLTDVIFTVDGSSDLDKARTLKSCWSHSDIFGKLKEN